MSVCVEILPPTCDGPTHHLRTVNAESRVATYNNSFRTHLWIHPLPPRGSLRDDQPNYPLYSLPNKATVTMHQWRPCAKRPSREYASPRDPHFAETYRALILLERRVDFSHRERGGSFHSNVTLLELIKIHSYVRVRFYSKEFREYSPFTLAWALENIYSSITLSPP